MLSKLARCFLSITLCAPILLPLSVIEFNKTENMMDWHVGWLYLILAIVMSALYLCLIWQYSKKLQPIQIEIKSAKNVREKPIKFLLICLLPFVDLVTDMDLVTNITNLPLLLLFIIIISIFLTIMYLRAYIYSPLLMVLGYDFYEVTIKSDDGTDLLITRQKTVVTGTISQVVQITKHVLLESSHA